MRNRSFLLVTDSDTGADGDRNRDVNWASSDSDVDSEGVEYSLPQAVIDMHVFEGVLYSVLTISSPFPAETFEDFFHKLHHGASRTAGMSKEMMNNN